MKPMNLRNEFVPYEQALTLTNLGFDEDCFMIYYDETGELRTESNFLYSRDIKAPLYQQVTDWFRVNYKLHIHIYYLEETNKWYCDIYKLPKNGLVNRAVEIKEGTYEQVRLEGIKMMIHYALKKLK
jgi:hypothetical protein